MSENKSIKKSEELRLKKEASKILKLILDNNLSINHELIKDESNKIELLKYLKYNIRKEKRKLINQKHKLLNANNDFDDVQSKIKFIDNKEKETINLFNKIINERIKKYKTNNFGKEKKDDKREDNELQKINNFISYELKTINDDELSLKKVDELLEIKRKYDRLLQKERKIYKIIEKTIELNYIKNEISYLPFLYNKLIESSNNKIFLLKIINYLEKQIRFENKKISKLKRKYKHVEKEVIVSTDDIEIDTNKQYELVEVLSIYLDKINEYRDIGEVNTLLQNYPEIYEVKDRYGNYLFERIVDNYINNILNKKLKDEVLDSILYQEKLIKNYINYSVIVDNSFINYLENKIEKVYMLLEKNEYSLEKKHEVRIHLEKMSELINHYIDEYSIKKKKNNKKVHEDITNEEVITIDSDKTNTHEDAFSVYKVNDSYRLTIYVTDVSSFILKDSIEDFNARASYKRGDAKIFPKSFYKNFSLDQGRNRYAFAYTFTFTKTFEIKEFKVKKTKIRVNKNFNYFDASKTLKDNKSKYYDILSNAKDLANNMMNEGLINIHKSSDLKPSDIVEIFTIFSKNYIAKKCSDLLYPYVLQNRALTYGVSNKEVLNNDLSVKIYNSKENRDLSPTGEFTSPARSYISLFNQRLHYRYFISNKKLLEAEKDSINDSIDELCRYINDNEKEYIKS